MRCRCGSELPDGFYLCAACGERLEYALAEVDATMQTLVAGLARTSLTAGYGERVNGGGRLHAPLPINEGVHDAKHALHTWLMKTSLMVADLGGKFITKRDAPSLASFLITNLDLIRRLDFAHKLEAELRALLKAAERSTQPPGERVNVGECGYVYEGQTCTNPLTPLRDQETIKCRVCGTDWDVKARQRDAIGGAWLAIGFPATIIRALAVYGITIKPKHFENWVRLGHLKPAAEQDGRKQYRVNEVWAVARRMQERKKVS